MMGSEMDEWIQEKGDRAVAEIERQGKPMTKIEFFTLMGIAQSDAPAYPQLWQAYDALEANGYKIVKK